MSDEEELKARKEAAEKDLGFFSLYEDQLLTEKWLTPEELEDSINDALDDLIDTKNQAE
ncbi:MAG: diguanylate cyclase [Bacteroides sp.]|nr:diguanylate cyclase [Bacteroides sp.]